MHIFSTNKKRLTKKYNKKVSKSFFRLSKAIFQKTFINKPTHHFD